MFQWNQTYIVNSADAVEQLESIFRVHKATELNADGFVAIYKNEYVAPVKGSVLFNWSELTAGTGFDGATRGRIKLYIRLSGSNNSYYANDMVFKGKPLVYEFKTTFTPKEIADLINKINTMYDDKFLKVTGDQEQIIFEGDQYTLFTEAVIEKFVPASDITGGSWEFVYGGVITPCENGFGTYEQVQKDLRLPTTENTGWTTVNEGELPTIGATYDQYTIEYCNEVGVQGAAHIGDVVTAKTTHAFYVNKTITDFETKLKAAIAASDNTEMKILDKKGEAITA